MLERMHQLGPLKLAAIIAVLLAVTGVVVLALSRGGGSESSPEAARNPAQSESADNPPSSTDAGIDDAGDDPNPTNRGSNGAAQASDSEGQNRQEPEPSSKEELPPKAAKHPQGGAHGDDESPSDQLPSNLPPELERLLGGVAGGK